VVTAAAAGDPRAIVTPWTPEQIAGREPTMRASALRNGQRSDAGASA
jgi:hypothetical protein